MSSASSPIVRHRQAWLQKAGPEIRIHYAEALPPEGITWKGTIILIHGFPESSYQFREVIPPLAAAGYYVLAPDYRGAGYSSKPPDGYTKKQMSTDLYKLVTEHVGVKDKVHLVGHDIGGMIAHAYVVQYPDAVASAIWGECPLPGSTLYDKSKHSRMLWHFDFQSTPDISLALVQGKERMYLNHFYHRLAQDPACFTPEVLSFYTEQYSIPGAMKSAFAVYANFENDAEDNRQWRQKNGKVKVKNMVLNGGGSFLTADEAKAMANEFYENVNVGTVEGSGHYIAEEQPEGFVKEVLRFIEK